MMEILSLRRENISSTLKDKIEREASRRIVYKIKCKDCDCVYIGQTSRAPKTRVKEHTKAIAILDENSLLAKHRAPQSPNRFDERRNF